MLRSLSYCASYYAAYIARRRATKRRRNSRPNYRLQSNWESLLHPRSCRHPAWASTCRCISSRNSTLPTLELRPYILRTPYMPSSRRYPHHRHTQLRMALHTTVAMHSHRTHRPHILDLRLGSMHSFRLWIRDIHNRATLPQQPLPISRTLRHKRRSSIIRRLESPHTTRLWSLQLTAVATNLCNIMAIRPHHYHRHRSARCQHPHSSTHDRHLFPVIQSQDTHSNGPMAGAMEAAWNLKGGRSMGALSRSIIHRFMGYIKAFWGLWRPYGLQCLRDFE